MAQAKARLSGGAERPRNRPVRPAAPDYAAILRGAQTCDGAEVRDAVEQVDSAQVLRAIGAEISAEVEARLVSTGADAAALEAALAVDLYEQGVLSLGAHIPSLACGGREVGRLLAAYDAVLPGLALRAQGAAFNRRAERRA
jgi:hypothetical protein